MKNWMQYETQDTADAEQRQLDLLDEQIARAERALKAAEADSDWPRVYELEDELNVLMGERR